MCTCDDGDPPKVIERTLRQARAGYPCCECSRRIQHGNWYDETRGLWGDSWDTFRTCLRCEARREAWTAVECAPVFGQLSEAIRECLVTTDYDRGIGRARRHIDRVAGREYLLALRAARDSVRVEVARLVSARAERYRLAGVAREQRKRALADVGGGI